VVEHAQCQPLSTGRAAHGDLPDKQRIGAFGDQVAGNRADDLFIDLGNDRGVAEVRAL